LKGSSELEEKDEAAPVLSDETRSATVDNHITEKAVRLKERQPLRRKECEAGV
jgi:hypothetical protein